MIYRKLILVLLFCSAVSLFGQKDYYLTSGGELLFQFANVKDNGAHLDNTMRFTAFFHAGSYLHKDFTSHVGIYTGLGFRNIGYIYHKDGVKIKRRSYALGVPLAWKIGNMQKTFFFAGGEYEWLFNYKEKHFVNGVKSKFTEWFSPRTPAFIPSVFAGVKFKGGMSVRVKYYLANFLNQSYRDSQGNYPFAGQEVRLFYISFSMNLAKSQIEQFTKPKKKRNLYQAVIGRKNRNSIIHPVPQSNR